MLICVDLNMKNSSLPAFRSMWSENLENVWISCGNVIWTEELATFHGFWIKNSWFEFMDHFMQGFTARKSQGNSKFLKTFQTFQTTFDLKSFKEKKGWKSFYLKSFSTHFTSINSIIDENSVPINELYENVKLNSIKIVRLLMELSIVN